MYVSLHKPSGLQQRQIRLTTYCSKEYFMKGVRGVIDDKNIEK